MAVLYGVLRGRPDRYQREDRANTPHLQIRVLDDTGQPWRIAVNVQSSDRSEVVYWVVDPLVGHPLLDGLPALQSGFTQQTPTSSTTLDFVKAPLFDFGLGRALPPTGSGNGDDLQDLLSLYLDQCKAAEGEIFAFGAKFTSNQHLPIDIDFGNTDGLHGVHDIHMNQGNTGSFAADNGVHHDGGLLLSISGRYVALLLAFQTQLIPTDSAGAPTPSARPVSELIGRPTSNPIATDSDIYIAHALINPVGADPGHEIVVLANLATTTHELTNWTLTDRNNRTTPITASIDPGGVLALALDGTGVQLGNNGGSLTLHDDTGQMLDSVTYDKTDATTENRYVRFRT
jgi:uncharacterized protein YukJ